jgi:hypothetical protein
MAEIIIEKPTMQKVIYKLEKPSEELIIVLPQIENIDKPIYDYEFIY